ncbi:MAG: hypothetical protein HY775_05050 [Acidobacteria bacterium]|nr:hypothetical protein [Acidobacteriota bacterium]
MAACVAAFLLLSIAGGYLVGLRSRGSERALPPAPSATPVASSTPSVEPSPEIPSTTPSPAPDLFPPGHDSDSWIRIHPKAAGKGCAVCHPVIRCTRCHGTEVPHPRFWREAHGKVALARPELCDKCHKDEKQKCASCHGLTMPHPANWSEAHRPVAKAGNSVCARCHTQQDCSNCHKLTTPESCKTCHEAKHTAVAKAGGHDLKLCLTCHPQNPAVVGPGRSHRTKPSCLDCHDADKLAPQVAVESQRDWMKREGEGKGVWVERGKHSRADLTRCQWCHQPHDAAATTFPPGVKPTDKNCAPSCHVWVQGSVVSRGFTNSSKDPEQTTYRGTIEPGKLLAGSEEAHATDAEMYPGKGCAGRCHDGQHGTITLCIQCHNYKDFTNPQNLHDTHATLVGAEGPVADPENNPPGGSNTSCRYCHGSPPLSNASCWNCHLSAHNPIVPYWKAKAE